MSRFLNEATNIIVCRPNHTYLKFARLWANIQILGLECPENVTWDPWSVTIFNVQLIFLRPPYLRFPRGEVWHKVTTFAMNISQRKMLALARRFGIFARQHGAMKGRTFQTFQRKFSKSYKTIGIQSLIWYVLVSFQKHKKNL